MTWRDGYIAVDWGTTNRRAWRVAADGSITQSFEDDLGLLAVPAGGFPAAAAAIRQRLGDHPMMLAGMVGSNRGWREAPYVPCPAGADALAAAVAWIEPERTGIVPGVCQRGEAGADVMRGEEVQVLGAVTLGQAPQDSLVCHPGTHAKWIQLQAGRIAHFRTTMTGEMFNLLKTHSILAPQLQGDVSPDDAGFSAGVAAAFAGENMLSDLFRIRARHLLGGSVGEPASYASGLLIGSEVCAAVAKAGGSAREVVLIGRPDLCALYEAALTTRGVSTRRIDGAQAFLAGIRLITEML
ncbi:2-dehydro-3-deoxygalactonokinase [Sphingomonas sp.]|jgi:2-dehydro-3-deoxygalactonokinase|uniref:2-dehydro-3-deoxygalactonokinase n=1 Tax=Sphingomonas sp. TaxID=28214 RepID=UPI002E379ABF|nr:2-dehydro-3-deoxygalactonokinase [Sphingomonas sp.]HEX4694668.1 2-dehydro-3-deoxygalactonokinase [Sphingomonas sp.]